MKKIIISFVLAFSFTASAQQKTIPHTSPGGMKEVLDPTLGKLDSVTRKYSNINGKLYEVTKRFYTPVSDTVNRENFSKKTSYRWEKFICNIPKDLHRLTNNELQKMVMDGDNCVVQAAFPKREYNFLYAPGYAKHYTFDGYNVGFQFHWRIDSGYTLGLHSIMICFLTFLLFFPTVLILFYKKNSLGIKIAIFISTSFFFFIAFSISDKSSVFVELSHIETWLNLVNLIVLVLFFLCLFEIKKNNPDTVDTIK